MMVPEKRIEVAVGILISSEDELLLTSRPMGKAMAGYWEFPGGKLEAGETVEEALRRELQEELGICIGKTKPWKVTEYDYPHGNVRLHWCKVFDWTGELQMREEQSYVWQHLPLSVTPVLPGALPILEELSQFGVR